MNSLKIFGLMTAMLALFAAIGYLTTGPQGMVIALLVGMAINLIGYWKSDKVVLAMYKAREIDAREHPRLYRIVTDVCRSADPDMPIPKICIVPRKEANAFATGRDIDHCAVAVTEGLLTLLDKDEELEAVIGHEIAHILNRDMLIGTIAAGMAAGVGIIATIARFGLIFGGGGRDDDRGGGLAIIAAIILAPIAATMIRSMISRQREFKADKMGCEITTQYNGLISALQKLHQPRARMNLDSRPATAHLMIANPLSGKGLSSLFSTHPPVEERIARLQNLLENSIYE